MECPKNTTHESLQTPFTKLSDDCIAEILSRTLPRDALRFALVSKWSKSAAESNNVWERFLHKEMLSRSASPLVYGSKKELYSRLCNSHVLLDDGKLICSFSLSRKTGKNCFMVGAKDLVISGDDNIEHRDWTSHTDSRFSEVVQLKFVCWIDIRGKIKTRMLSPKTRYRAYLIFKLADGYSGLAIANVVFRGVHLEAYKHACSRATIVHLYDGMAMRIDDGWMEIKLGDFCYDDWDEGEVEARFMEIQHLSGKSGLLIEGIEFRPSTRKAS